MLNALPLKKHIETKQKIVSKNIGNLTKIQNVEEKNPAYERH